MTQKTIYNGLFILSIVLIGADLWVKTRGGESAYLWPLGLIAFAVGYMIYDKEKKNERKEDSENVKKR